MSEDLGKSPFLISFYPVIRLDDILQNEQNFAVFCYSSKPLLGIEDNRVNSIPLEPLGAEPVLEVWSSREPVVIGGDDFCRYFQGSSFLLVCAKIDENQFDHLAQATHVAYHYISRIKKSLGYDYNVRIWNYFRDINREDDNEERYKRFCSGRHNFLKSDSLGCQNFSSASAIGTGHPALHIISLSVPARHHVSHLENPHQISAYHYPLIYGRKSPSFARATVLLQNQSRHLYISGTASILGHQSKYQGDIAGQTRLSLENIAVMIDCSRARYGFPESVNSISLLKVYIRHPDDMAKVRGIVEERFQYPDKILYLQGDICRKELLIEIEALYIDNIETSFLPTDYNGG